MVMHHVDVLCLARRGSESSPERRRHRPPADLSAYQAAKSQVGRDAECSRSTGPLVRVARARVRADETSGPGGLV